ncbi:hypothetical protein PoHVEF18_004838 [Penicillium ochrochloron]
MDTKGMEELHIDHVETCHTVNGSVTGNIKLIRDSEVVLVPTPTNDPNGKSVLSSTRGFSFPNNDHVDPLNLPVWQKYLILLIVGTYAATGNLMTSGLSAFLPAVKASYNGDNKANDLITWPAFFMGVGNLLSIPIASAVGRRPTYLVSTILLAFGCLWCAKSESLESHIAGRDIMSIAAGTAEALCPIIVEEIFYLHERAKVVAAYSSLQTVGTAALIIASPYIASNPSLGWRWWYGIFGCVSGAVAVLSIIFVKETQYERPLEALRGEGIESDGVLVPVTTNTKRVLDDVNYRPRSFLRDMAPWSGSAKWSRAVECCKQMGQVIFFPDVLWLILL